MQRGSALIFLGIGLVFLGVISLKITGRDLFWAVAAGGAVVGCIGGISVSQKARA